jgi:hypothetical protein
MKKAELVALLLDIYSVEDGNNFNTGTRLTMKPLAGPLPRKKKPASSRPRSRKTSAPAA